jgi:phosphatidylserine decarboxylase
MNSSELTAVPNLSKAQQKMRTQYPIIAKEGRLIIAITLAIALLIHYYIPAIGLLGWVLLLFVVQFFRDPIRLPAGGDKDITSPADGRIVVVGEAIDPLLKIPALKISVFMNVFNVHSNKAPTTGTIINREYHAGSFLNADLDKASEMNERCGITINRADDVNVTFVQIAGLVARRILNYTTVGDTLNKGDRYGFIRFGSRVDVYLPLTARPRVAVGDIVSNNSSILATLL